MKRTEWRWLGLYVLAIPAFGLAAIVLDPSGWVFWRAGAFSDLWISHAPNLRFIREAIQTWHAIPLWNPLILSGMPLAADPLAGLWYLPHLLAWLGPGGFGFNLLFWFHLALAAAGVFTLLRSEGASHSASLLGALVFAATPKLIGHVGLGHLTLVEAVCWTPWVLVCVRGAIESCLEPQRRRLRFALLGALLGLTFVIDPRWSVPAGLMALAYAGKCLAHSQERRERGWRSLRAAPIALAMAAALAAPLGLPLAELAGRTTRALMTAEEATSLSLAPVDLLGLLVFRPGAWPETQTYLGATVLVLIGAALAAAPSRHRFWWAALMVFGLLSFGLPARVYAALSGLVPGIGLLRVPARFYLLAALAGSVLAGHAIDRLTEAADGSRALTRARLAAVFAGATILAIGLARAFFPTPAAGGGDAILVWAAAVPSLLVVACTAWVLRMPGGRPRLPGAGAAFALAIVALDLGWANLFTLETRSLDPSSDVSTCGLEGDSGRFGDGRDFSPSYSLPQPYAQGCEIELADGVSPLQLTAYRDYMAAATGFQPAGYSVTLPPLPQGNPRVDWHPRIDAEMLGRLNVKRIVAAYPLEAESLTLLSAREGQWVYLNEVVRGRAWLEAAGGGLPDEWRPVESLDWSPNRIRIRAEGPGKLVLSEVDYPGWQARVDGESVLVERHEGLLRSIELPAGSHDVQFDYRPLSVFAGVALAALALAALAALWVRR